MSTFSQIPLMSSGIVVGIIIFQSFIVAPSLFKHVNEKDTSSFLRHVFPKMFILIATISVISFIVSFAIEENRFFIKAVSLATIISMIVCYLMVPATNRAKDAKKEVVFQRLHAVSVILTVVILLLNFLLAFL